MSTAESTSPAVAGKVIALTGGARGIGLETVKHLVAAGAKVGVGDMDIALLRDELGKIAGETAAYPLDVTDRSSFQSFLDGVEKDLGPIDILINNAGIMALHPFTEETDEISRKQIDVNLIGPMYGMKIALPGMLERGRGHIINVASTAGRFGVPGAAMYSASKFAIFGMTEAVSNEYAKTPINFSAVCPVIVETDLIRGVKGRTRGVPLLQPEDVAKAILQTIEKPRFEVFVPRSTKIAYVAATLTPPRLRRIVEKLTRADRVLVEVDHAERASYEDHAFSGEGDTTTLPAGAEPGSSALASERERESA
ncbi:MAG: SDR family oxidoreductase [Solirubrobacterales bacterium]